MMPVTILHVGLPLDHPLIPPGEHSKIAARIAELQAEMQAIGYGYEILQLCPDDGLHSFKDRLRAEPPDGVLFGGGIAGDESLRFFLEDLVDAVHTTVPQAKVMFYSHEVEVIDSVRRWFPSPKRQITANTFATSAPIAFIPINNPETARKFYEGTLGLRFVSDDQFAMIFRVGPGEGTMLRIVRTGEFEPAPFTIFGWETPNIEQSIDELKAKGVEFLRFSFFEQDKRGIWHAPNGNSVAWFKDPDGNTLSLSKHN